MMTDDEKLDHQDAIIDLLHARGLSAPDAALIFANACATMIAYLARNADELSKGLEATNASIGCRAMDAFAAKNN
jgi:hypothetical protein